MKVARVADASGATIPDYMKSLLIQRLLKATEKIHSNNLKPDISYEAISIYLSTFLHVCM